MRGGGGDAADRVAAAASHVATATAAATTAASHKIATNVANRATRHGSRALNVALAAATPLLRHKFSAFLLRASADGRAVAQIYPKPLDKKELKASNQPPPPALYTLRVRRLNYTTDAAIRTLALKPRRRLLGVFELLLAERLRVDLRDRAAVGRRAEQERRKFMA